MINKTIKIIIILIISFMIQSCMNKSHMEIKMLSDEIDPKVYIFDTTISMPLGYYILIKKNNKYCALKLLEYGKHKDKYYDGYIIYEFYQTNSSGNFFQINTKKGKNEASSNILTIIGRLSFEIGNPDIACGDIHVEWMGSNSIGFADGRKRGDEADWEIIKECVEISPTKWREIKDVNVFNKNLSWYKFNPSREKMVIPINEL